jgi:hypothetical protein
MVLAILALFTIWFRGASPDTTPSMGFMLFSLGYGFLFAIVGGYITAMIAGRAEMKHAIALAGICVLMGFISMIFAAGQQPLWYQIANMGIAVFGVVLGSYFRSRRRNRAEAG